MNVWKLFRRSIRRITSKRKCKYPDNVCAYAILPILAKSSYCELPYCIVDNPECEHNHCAKCMYAKLLPIAYWPEVNMICMKGDRECPYEYLSKMIPPCRDATVDFDDEGIAHIFCDYYMNVCRGLNCSRHLINNYFSKRAKQTKQKNQRRRNDVIRLIRI